MQRRAIVEAARAGASQRSVARRFGVSLLTVQRWLERAADLPLDEVDWSDRSSAPLHQARRTSPEQEELVLGTRQALREGILREHGALAIRRSLERLAVPPEGPLPSVRTIGRILERRGVLDGRHRERRPAPPPGWYLPGLMERWTELDAVDSIEDLRVRGGLIEVLTLISLHGALPGAWPGPPLVTDRVMAALLGHWRAFGLPGYAQFDDAMVFAGTHHVPSIGRVGRMSLSLGVTPVFVPPREMGFQGAIESFNGRWQRAVWDRPPPRTSEAVADRSDAWLAALRERHAVRIEAAPLRAPFPADWDPDAPPARRGIVVHLRRTDEQGAVTLLRQRFDIDPHWPHRLVRAEVDLDADVIRFHALRRRDPAEQPLLREVPFRAPWPTAR